MALPSIKEGLKAKTYAEKLRDPRWQKKRLEILERDQFTCKSCWDKESTLHVHHIRYSSNDPWESNEKDLITLCDNCHEAWHHTFDANIDTYHIEHVIELRKRIIRKHYFVDNG